MKTLNRTIDYLCCLLFLAIPVSWYEPTSSFGQFLLYRSGNYTYGGYWANGELMICDGCGKPIKHKYNLGFHETGCSMCLSCTPMECR